MLCRATGQVNANGMVYSALAENGCELPNENREIVI
jgi:hypothetical protein